MTSRQQTKGPPATLLQAYNNKSIAVGRSLLGKLLHDPRMERAWPEIGRRLQSEQQWLLIWGAIVHAMHMSKSATKTRKRPSDERDEFHSLAASIRKLTNKLRNKQLDVELFELWPQDVLAALNVGDWHKLDGFARSAAAHRVMSSWPRVSEVLDSLTEKADSFAAEALSRPRAVSRATGKVAERTFAWHLASHFRGRFGSPLLGTVAKITTVALDANPEVTRNFVQEAIRVV